MSAALTIAKKDFRDAIRSRGLWILTGLFFLLSTGTVYTTIRSASPDASPEDLLAVGVLFVLVLFVITFLVPITGLFVSLKSIVREFESGNLKLLLSLPHDRRDVVVGKFLGRTAVFTAAIVAGWLPAGIVLTVWSGELLLLGAYLLFLAFLIVFGIVFLAAGVGISAFVATETRATILGITGFILLYAWGGIYSFINGQLDLLSGNADRFVRRFELQNVYFDLMTTALTVYEGDVGTPSSAVLAETAFDEGFEPGATPEVPFYLQEWVSIPILALWIAVPVLVGYLRFSRRDL